MSITYKTPGKRNALFGRQSESLQAVYCDGKKVGDIVRWYTRRNGAIELDGFEFRDVFGDVLFEDDFEAPFMKQDSGDDARPLLADLKRAIEAHFQG